MVPLVGFDNTGTYEVLYYDIGMTITNNGTGKGTKLGAAQSPEIYSFFTTASSSIYTDVDGALGEAYWDIMNIGKDGDVEIWIFTANGFLPSLYWE